MTGFGVRRMRDDAGVQVAGQLEEGHLRVGPEVLAEGLDVTAGAEDPSHPLHDHRPYGYICLGAAHGVG